MRLDNLLQSPSNICYHVIKPTIDYIFDSPSRPGALCILYLQWVDSTVSAIQ